MEVKGQFRTVKCSFLENQLFAVNVSKKQFRNAVLSVQRGYSKYIDLLSLCSAVAFEESSFN